MSNGNQGKVAVVTGTSTGIGLHTAVQLAQTGFAVVATMRDLGKAGPLMTLAEQSGVKLDLRRLDVEDSASIKECVSEILAVYGRIDLLVNNAGAGFLGSLEQTSLEQVRKTLETNFFGVWQMTQAVFPAMRTAKSGRIISVSSVGGLVGQPFNDAYCAAKFAVEGFMESLAPVAAGLGIKVSVVEPGPVNTEFVANVQATRPEVPQEQLAAYGPMLQKYMGAITQSFATLGQTPQEIAEIIVEAATTDEPHLHYITSANVKERVGVKFNDLSGDSLLGQYRKYLQG